MANVVLLQGKRTTFRLPQTPLKYLIQKFQTNHKAISIKAIRTACLYVFILNQKVEKYKSRLAISRNSTIFSEPLCFSLLILLLLLTILIMVSATPCVFTITEKDFLQISSNSSAKEREINSTPSMSITHFALPDSLMIFSIAPALLRERISGPNRSKTLMFFFMTSFRRITSYIIYNETIQIYCRDR